DRSRSRSAVPYAASALPRPTPPGTSAGRCTFRDPLVVGTLEPLQDRREQPRAVDRRTRLEPQRRGPRSGLGGEVVVGLVHVHPDAEDYTPVAGLGEDPGDLPPVDQHVVRELDRGLDTGSPDRLSYGSAGDERELG